MEVYSLFELNQYIKQVIALNFVETVWISCEIGQVSSSRGHCYLELVEKDELTDQVKARSSAVIWYREFSFIKKKLGKIADQVLQDGMEVKVKVEIDFHERYGMKLVIKDIDPSYTYGQLAIQREQIIDRLNKEDRMQKNGLLPFPSVVQHIAVISSHTAAGYQDLCSHLEQNPYGFHFNTSLFPAAMQGERTEMEVVAALREIRDLQEHDLIVITRGGGSRLDLAGFDSYAISKEISEIDIPVITGIGHDIDQSITDMVAAIALKTPTAVANFLIDHNASFESALYDMAVNIKLFTQERLHEVQLGLTQFPTYLEQYIQGLLRLKKDRLNQWSQDLPLLIKQQIQSYKKELLFVEEKLEWYDPKKILSKGYSMTYMNGEFVKSKKSLKKGDQITTEFSDGKINSTVN